MTRLPPIAGRLWIVQLCEVLSSRIAEQVKTWPKKDGEGNGNQLLRATDSIGQNISEGYARVHVKDRAHFVTMAQGSLEEALFELRRARDRGLVSILDAGILSGLYIKLSKALAAFGAYIRQEG